MLSIFKLSSSQQADSYYQKADYYTKGESGVDVRSQWLGQGAENRGLSGEVDPLRFRELLDGKVDDTTQLGAKRHGKNEHTPGWDLTFSAPKSVSILALVSGDKRLIDAHHASVQKLAGIIETRYLKSRRNLGQGNVVEIPLKEMVAAAFTHTTSRKLDPQLHTHMVLMNMGKDKNDKAMSLHSHGFFKDKMFLGQLYRNELAKHVQSLGYEIDYDEKKGTFEIAGIDPAVLEVFSQRRQEVEAAAEAFGLEGGKAMEKAALNSREAKKNVPEADVIRDWDERLKTQGYSPEALLKATQPSLSATVEKLTLPHQVGVVSTPLEKATDPVDLAIAMIAHYESVFDYQTLTDKALKLSKGALTVDDIDQRLQQRLQQKVLLRSEHNPSFYTTQEAIRRENYILDLLEHGRHQHTPMASPAKIEQLLTENASFTEGQARSFRDLLSSHDRYMGLQGYAGVGKTYMMKPLIEVAQQAGYTVRGFAPNGTQAEQLERETGVNANTLKSHLIKLETGKLQPEKQELWVVDEAGMVNSKDMADLLSHAHRVQARVILPGDYKQLGAVEAGNPFQLFMDKGMDFTVNDSIIRQKDGTPLKDSIEYLIDGKTAQSFKRLDKRIEQHKDPVKALVDAYLAKEKGTFDEVALIVPDVATRDEVNQTLRETFRERGWLKGKDTEIVNLRASKIDGPMKREAQFYKPGQLVRFNRSYKSLGVDANVYYQVQKVRHGLVYLSDGKKTVEWNPKKVAGGEHATSTYIKHQSRYAEGDRIRWKDKNDDQGLKNGHLGMITELTAQQMTVAFGEKKVRFDLDNMDARHFQHAYAQTAYSVQGQTYREAMMLAESWRRNLVNQKSFYVAITRAKQQAHIFTEDKEKLERGIQDRLGYKGNSHDILSDLQVKEHKEKRATLFDYVHGTSGHTFTHEPAKQPAHAPKAPARPVPDRDKQLDF